MEKLENDELVKMLTIDDRKLFENKKLKIA